MWSKYLPSLSDPTHRENHAKSLSGRGKREGYMRKSGSEGNGRDPLADPPPALFRWESLRKLTSQNT